MTTTNHSVAESFRPRLGPRWQPIQVGGGHILIQEHGLRLLTVGASQRRYADAQIHDYTGRSQGFPWRPPLRMTVRARTSASIVGTAGFGFWNNPFSPFGGMPRLPAAVWFFYASPPSNIPIANGVPGFGWKCAVIDATTPHAVRWAPVAPLVVLLNRYPPLARRIWPRVQHDLAIAEHALPPLNHEWHSYTIVWEAHNVAFYRDHQLLFSTPHTPHGPLGFVAWIDNQYAIATPQGQFGWGLLDAAQPQSLDLASLRIEPG